MRKIHYVIFIAFVLIFMPCIVVNAEDDTTCSYASKATLNKSAGKVKVSLDYVYDENNNVSFNITIYNITDDIYVGIEKNETFVQNVNSTMTDNGNFTFNDSNIDTLVKYKFIINSNKYGCAYTIKTLNLVKPMKNKFSEYMICRYPETRDYVYCKEWITTVYSLTDEQIYQKIVNERNKKSTTTACQGCEIEKEQVEYNSRMSKLRKYIIIGLSIGIVLDATIMILLIVKIRRDAI